MRVLEEAQRIVRKRWGLGWGWKVALVVFGILLVVAGTFYLIGKFIKGLTAGGYRNADLYIPRIRRR